MLVESVQQLSRAGKHTRLEVQRAEVLTRTAIDLLFALRIRCLTGRLGHDTGQPPAVGSDEYCDLLGFCGYPEFLEGPQPGRDPGLDGIDGRSIEVDDPRGG